MSVTMLPAVRIGTNAWRLRWTSNLAAPTFYIYRDGELVLTTSGTTYDLLLGTSDSPMVQVLDDPAASPADAWPGRITLCWYAVAAVEYYRIEEYVGGVWTLRAKVRDRGEGYFTWTSRFLEDSADHEFRVVAVAASGQQSTAAEVSALMVRHPDAPNPSYAYSNSTHKVTVSAT